MSRKWMKDVDVNVSAWHMAAFRATLCKLQDGAPAWSILTPPARAGNERQTRGNVMHTSQMNINSLITLTYEIIEI